MVFALILFLSNCGNPGNNAACTVSAFRAGTYNLQSECESRRTWFHTSSKYVRESVCMPVDK